MVCPVWRGPPDLRHKELHPGNQEVWMTIRNFIAAAVLVTALAACGKPVPPEKSAYVGEWQSPTMALLITQDGSVRYKRIRGGMTTSVDGPLKGFAGDNFEVGVGPMSTTFVVSKPPYQDGCKWKMVVDGVELTRTTP
jgi:hypothetical protein